MDEINRMTARLTVADGLASTLAAGFDAFELIRAVARACEDRAAELFAAFMMAAGAAAEGRNTLLAAPSLPPPGTMPAVGGPGEAADVGQAADELAVLAALLAQQLSRTAATVIAGDRDACQTAAGSAREIRRLLARTGDETPVR